MHSFGPPEQSDPDAALSPQLATPVGAAPADLSACPEAPDEVPDAATAASEAAAAETSPPARPAGFKPWHAALLLFFLAPAMARLFSASLSPAEYFSPIVWIGLHASIGAGAVLLREWAVRRRIGPWGRLLLGLALGLFIEGLITRNLFAAENGELGTLVGYARSLGVNWLWGLLTLAFHATQSFLLPLLFVDLLLPQYRAEAALSRKATVWLSLLAGASAVFGFTGISANIDPNQVYHPGLLALLLSLAGVLGLPWLAARLDGRHLAAAAPGGTVSAADGADPVVSPDGLVDAGLAAAGYELQAGGGGLRFVRRGERPLKPSPRALGWLTGLSTALLLFIMPALYKDVLKLPGETAFLISLICLGAAIWLAVRLNGRLSSAHQFALLAGSQGCWIVLCLLLPLDDGLRPDETTGMPLLGLLSLGLLILTARRLPRMARQRRLVQQLVRPN